MKMQDAGYRMQDAGYLIQDAGCRIPDTGCRRRLMAFQTYKDLELYQLSHDLAIEIHKVNKPESLYANLT